MKKILGFLCALLLLAGTAGLAGATPWTDTVNGPYYIGNWGSYSYIHDITDDGFVPLVDIATNYVLTLSLYDDARGLNELLCEVAFVNQPGVVNSWFYDFTLESEDFGASILGLIEVNLLGTLHVSICSVLGDFYFGQSVLTASNNCAPVPEPSTMLLLGVGLMGLAGLARKRFITKA